MSDLIDIHIKIDKELYERVKALKFHKGDITFFLQNAVRREVERKEKEQKDFDEYMKVKEEKRIEELVKEFSPKRKKRGDLE